MKIAFDIDDTILIPSVARFGVNAPNHDTIQIYKWFQNQGCEMILWSGSGVDWARTWGNEFELQPFEVRVKEKSNDIDIAFDDCDVDLAKVNVRVKRVNNSISRKEWNKTKHN
ncbi:MAG TPA: hypothetical protein ENI76_02615 [Ignavibacteria bacterium]|nr:hypothetical protein [Ignavibacteria bacterium]